MLKKTLRMISLVMASAMVITLVSAPQCMAASRKKPRLVKTVEFKKYNRKTKKWETNTLSEYTYNRKGNPKKLERSSFTGYGNFTQTFSYWDRKNGKRKYAKYKQTGIRWQGMGGYYVKYTQKGKIYYNKYGHRTKERYKYSSRFEDGSSAGSWSSTEKYKYKACGYYLDYSDLLDYGSKNFRVIKRNRSTLKKIRYKDFVDNKWRTRYTFNKKGLLRGYKYRYYKKSGLVRSIKYRSDGESYKFVFKYSRKKTTKIRYNAMINSFLDNEHFYWY